MKIFIRFFSRMIASALFLFLCSVSFCQQQPIGLFDGQGDVGNVLHPGSATYNAETQQYLVEGSGINMWFDHDEFHFVWKKMKGDFILTANAEFIGKGAEQHRKWGWMVRSTLDSTSAHINAVVHGDGLTSLQFRRKAGATTEEIRSTLTFANVVQLERRGSKYIMSVAHKGDTLKTEEISDISLGDEVYVGIFVTSHNQNTSEKAVFSNVRIVVPAKSTLVPYREYIGSELEILDMATEQRKIIYHSPISIQAPNWSTNGKYLIYNSDGLLYKFDLAQKTPSVLNTDFAKKNNNDHVISFDGKMLGISNQLNEDGSSSPSLVYVMPITGGKPRKITPTGPSYCHGWSPDGKYLLFTGSRNNEFDIYKVPAQGGEEIRLTDAKGLDDGSEYTPDGKYIYFNSNRSGLMQIWRMKADGSAQEQVTNDPFNNWFPHVSPDGKWIVYISFQKDVPPGDHPFYKHVYLQLMPTSGGPSRVIAYLYGGQGTINTPSWSPDSKKIAFVSNTDKY